MADEPAFGRHHFDGDPLTLEGRIVAIEVRQGEMARNMTSLSESVGKLSGIVGEIQSSNRQRIAVDTALREAAQSLADQRSRQMDADAKREEVEHHQISVWQTNRGYWLAFFVAIMLVATFMLQVYTTVRPQPQVSTVQPHGGP